MTETHTIQRDRLARGDRDDELVAHVRRCPACAEFAARLDAVTTTASSLRFPAPPPNLSDRVVERVLSRRRPMARAHRRSLVRSTAVAAAAVFVLGLLALVPRGDGDAGDELLLAAATSTEQADSARMRLEVEGEVDLERSEGRSPEFDDVPMEMEHWLERRWSEVNAEFERQLREFEARAQETIDEGMRRMEEGLDRVMDGLGSRPGQPPPGQSPPAPPAPPAPRDGSPRRSPDPDRSTQPGPAGPRPQLPERITVGVAASAEGLVEFDGRLHLSGTLRPVSGTIPAPDAAADFAVRVDAGEQLVRTPDGSWVRVDAAGQAWAAVLTRPDGISRLLRSATGPVRVGRVTIEGRTLRHVRFAVDDDRAEAWLDDRNRVARITVTSEQALRGGRWRSAISAELSDFGVALPDTPRPSAAAAKVSPPSDNSMLVYPLGAAVAASLRER